MAGSVIGSDALFGGRLIESYRTFGAQVTQGDYQEGWRLPFEYLWHAEHGLLILWLASLAWCLATVRRSAASPRVRVGLAGLLIAFATLAISSTLLHMFVVYGRLARQLVPFFCLLTAFALGRIWASRSRVVRGLVPATIVILVAQAAHNSRRHYNKRFRTISSASAEFGRERSHLGERGTHLPRASQGRPSRSVRFDLPFWAPHPLEFLPYQCEGYTPAQRRVLRLTDIRMRILARLPTP